MSLLLDLKAGVQYRVLVDDECRFTGDCHDKIAITRTIRDSVGALLNGNPIRVIGSDGSRLLISAGPETADMSDLRSRGQNVRNVYGAVHNKIFEIFPGYGPTMAGWVMDTIVNKYDGTSGEWLLYSADGSDHPDNVQFAPKGRVRAKSATVFARVLIDEAGRPTVEVTR